ncbi:MAG: anti-sigma regulatory factor [Anaerolineae bacterium]|nr:anti-sigma regulatory factor [Anaerolineae bacterium]
MVSPRLASRTWSIEGMVDVVTARRCGLKTALSLGFSTPEATKIAVVISELGRNILLYAERGLITVSPHSDTLPYIEIIAQDHGPGIEDVERVLAGGYTTSGGLGKGVSGSRRLMDEFEIETAVGEGTKIRAVKRLYRRR